MYDADIRWTRHGVAHITAGDWGSLGFGQGYACARDRLPTLADHLLKVRGERARFFGAGEGNRHLHSDLGYAALGVNHQAVAMREAQPERIRQMVAGYTAGYNAALAEFGTAHLPDWCAGAPWIRAVDELDFYALFVDLCLMGSGRNLAGYVGSAVPPDAGGHAAPPPEPPVDGVVGESHLGSNGWALGRDATGGPGMVMANPHFPWYGEGKLWECHLRIPGELDVYGATLVGSPGVQIGFTRSLGFTHTFSIGSRFTVYRLTLDQNDPCAYRHGDTERPMVATTHSVQVRGDDGEVRTEDHTLWSSHHGPMLNLPFVGWSTDTGFAYRDANIGNHRFLSQVMAMNTVTDVPGLQDAFATHGGLPWVNTLAADGAGRCWYIDSSPTPNLTPATQERFVNDLVADPVVALMHTMRVALLDGSDPDTDWCDAPGAPGAGLVPFAELPQLATTDHVANSNDPYWRINATRSLPPASPMHGLHGAPLSARTRMNLRLVSGTGPVTPTGPHGTVTLDDLTALAFSGHSLTGLELANGVAERLRATGDDELVAAADVLDGWDRTVELNARGALLWREFICEFTDADLRGTPQPGGGAGALWAEPFDPARPLDTPTGLAPAPEQGADLLVGAMRTALAALAAAGIAPDAPLGDHQWVKRGDHRLALPGGGEPEGVADVSTPTGALARADLDPEPTVPATLPGRQRSGLTAEGYPVTYGVSFVMTVTLADPDDPTAQPVGRGLCVYGQSDLPDSDHHADQVGEFANRNLRTFALDDDAIAAALIDARHLQHP
jgi:acyl-homoserine-lactone acylase